MRRVLVLIAAVGAFAGCGEPDYCYGQYYYCRDDDDCYPAPLPRGRCLDDKAVGKICALYYENCPTKLRWAECAGVNRMYSPWAGRCVRPEFIPDAGTDGDMDAAADMSIEIDGPGPS